MVHSETSHVVELLVSSSKVPLGVESYRSLVVGEGVCLEKRRNVSLFMNGAKWFVLCGLIRGAKWCFWGDIVENL